MTRQGLSRASVPFAVLLLATAAVASQSDNQGNEGSAPLRLPISGSVSGGGTFAGTLSIDRFEARDGAVMAIGMVTGTVTLASAPVRTGLVGPVALPVAVGPGQAQGSRNSALAQQQATCQVLNLAIGAVNLNLLGFQVTTVPIGIDVSGDSAGVLGNLVCTIQQTLNNVVGLVGLLNQLLGVLTGLVGGLVP